MGAIFLAGDPALNTTQQLLLFFHSPISPMMHAHLTAHFDYRARNLAHASLKTAVLKRHQLMGLRLIIIKYH